MIRHSLLPFSKIILAGGDAAASLGALAAALILRYGGSPDPAIVELYAFAAPFLVTLWLAVLLIFGLYDIRLAKNEPAFYERLTRALAFALAVTVILFYFIPEFGLRPLGTLVIIFLALGVLLAVWRRAFNTLIARRTKSRILFYGFTEEGAGLARFLMANPQLGYLPFGYIADTGTAGHSGLALSSFSPADELAAIVREHGINLIVVAHDIKRTRPLIRSLFGVLPLGVGIVDFDRFYESVEGKVPVSLISESWFLENLIGQRRPRYEAAKRLLDLVLALSLGVATAILLPVIAPAVVLSTPGDVIRYRARRARKGDGIIFFRQPRVGRNGKVFDFLKFRSQRLGAERFGSEKDIGVDPRSYPIGDFLRKTYLDELPQVWNVIRGEMSFVGPRPERPEFVEELSRRVPFYRMRELVLPGITGWAQINMQNDASVADAPEKMQYDLYYIKNRSLFLDLTILLKTALKLLQRSGR
ncbi:MAG: exopolysaccharide biosynthesis polyprenyl glycosylphosphotransferase [Patescibacteria group bacterium]